MSFGSWVALTVGAADPRVSALIGIAPPVDALRLRARSSAARSRSSSSRASSTRSAPLKDMREFYARAAEPKELVVIDGADHLFDGKVGRGRRRDRGSAGGLVHDMTPSSFPRCERRSGKAPERRAARHAARRTGAPSSIAEALRRAPGIDPAEIDDVILGLRDAGGRAGPERRAHRQPARRHSGRARRRSRSTASARPACRRSRTPPSASCAASRRRSSPAAPSR